MADLPDSQPAPRKCRPVRPWMLLPLLVATGVALLLRPADPPSVSGSISHDAYVWQRAYTPTVVEAIRSTGQNFSVLAVLAAEVSFADGKPEVARIEVDYAALADTGSSIAICLRIGPYGGPFRDSDRIAGLLIDLAEGLVADAKADGIEPAELQIDFDCATAKLDSYRVWVAAIRRRVDIPVVITALPSWLDSPAFAHLARAADGYVLQVHSLQRPESPDEIPPLCDPADARRAVTMAGKVGVRFRVALPTYGYQVAFDSDGKFLGISAEGPARTWPEGAVLRELRADPAVMAELVTGWTQARTPFLAGIIWYRLPTRADVLNWPWPTLAAVMAGEVPKSDLRAEVRNVEPGLVEIDLLNAGAADAPLDVVVKARWQGGNLLASDAINGFRVDELAAESLRLTRPDDAPPGRLGPGERIKVAWMRLDTDREVEADVLESEP